MKGSEKKIESGGKDSIKIVYKLKEKKDLINILKAAPTTPVFHMKSKEKNLYIAHGLGNNLFFLETRDPIPEDEGIPYSGERSINLIELSSVEVLKLEDLAESLKRAKPRQASI